MMRGWRDVSVVCAGRGHRKGRIVALEWKPVYDIMRSLRFRTDEDPKQ